MLGSHLPQRPHVAPAGKPTMRLKSRIAGRFGENILPAASRGIQVEKNIYIMRNKDTQRTKDEINVCRIGNKQHAED